MKLGGIGALAMVMWMSAVVATPAVLLALTWKVNTPWVVGVPDSTPEELRVSPGGRVPEASENVGAGVPDAVKV